MFERFVPQPIEIGSPFAIKLYGQNLDDIKPLEMLWVEPGIFTMGSPLGQKWRNNYNEGHFQVTLTDGYWLSRYPITHFQWSQLVNYPKLTHPAGFENYPQRVGWYSALLFCAELQRGWLEGLRKMIPVGYRFTIPCEAQWEYACRAGTRTIFYNGDDPNSVKEIAWYEDNSDGKIHPVGEKLPNAWGFYDMLGNMSEICWDLFNENMPSEPQVNWIDNRMEESEVAYHVGKGGGSHSEIYRVRCGSRNYNSPDLDALAFRLCLTNIPHEFPSHMW